MPARQVRVLVAFALAVLVLSTLQAHAGLEGYCWAKTYGTTLREGINAQMSSTTRLQRQ